MKFKKLALGTLALAAAAALGAVGTYAGLLWSTGSKARPR